eukprot:5512964-Ditylum_brightwellii.AAC.1
MVASYTGILVKCEEAGSKRLKELSVNAFDEYGYTNEQAIAYERAGDFFVAQHDEMEPQYYGKAQALYTQWGAQ